MGNDLDAAQMLKVLTAPNYADTPSVAFLMIRPDPAMTSRIAQLGGVRPLLVENATLVRYSDGLPINLMGFDVRDRQSFRNVVAQGWFPQTGTQACPSCLVEDGKWRLHWRLPLVVMCSKHNTVLTTQCGGCGNRFRVRRYSPLRPVTGPDQPCGNQLGLRKHCEYSVLDHPSVAADADLVRMNSGVEQAMSCQPVEMLGQSADSRVFLAELRHVATLLLHLASRTGGRELVGWAEELQIEASMRKSDRRGPRWGISPPNGARVRGSALAAANEILAQADVTAAAGLLSPWLAVISDVVNGPHNWLVNRTVRSPTMDALMSAAVSARHHVGRRIARMGTTEGRLTLSAISQMIDRDIYLEHFAGMLGGYEWTGRLYVSLCIARIVASASNWAEAAESIDLDPDVGRRNARAASARMMVPPGTFADALDAATRALSQKTDFRRLEAGVRVLAADTESWFEEWNALVTPRRRPGSVPYLVTWMWCEVAQGLLDTSPAWEEAPTRHQKAGYRVFRDSLTPRGEGDLRALATSAGVNG